MNKGKKLTKCLTGILLINIYNQYETPAYIFGSDHSVFVIIRSDSPI